jgi:lipoyl(octanoyl) transferase
MIWRLIQYQSLNAFENMAIDEAVFRETIKNQGPTTLRFYGWNKPAVSLGYFQELQNEINDQRCRVTGVAVVRRITGGKAVYHKDDVTYSLAAANTERIFPVHIVRTYEIISRCLARGLSCLGIDACLAETGPVSPSRKKKETSCCFSVPFGNELLVRGKKICGSAQTRTPKGFLQHGSVLMTFDPAESAALIRTPHADRAAEIIAAGVTAVNQLIPTPVSALELCMALQRGFLDEIGVDLQEGSLTDAELALSRHLIKKYESDSWNRERQKAVFPRD